MLGRDEWRAMNEESSARHLAEALTALAAAGTIADQPVQPLARLLSGAMSRPPAGPARPPARRPHPAGGRGGPPRRPGCRRGARWRGPGGAGLTGKIRKRRPRPGPSGGRRARCRVPPP
ncbi:hypothetical protein ACFVHW_22745 [Streptomyces sp. NPDC127110]|uniref:hypothetical protein n=1 Tax=Streptomyces sp. NPDC127110 TaxID=3345362 RepID=UPI003636EBDE